MIHAIEQLPLDNKEHCGLLIQWYPPFGNLIIRDSGGLTKGPLPLVDVESFAAAGGGSCLLSIREHISVQPNWPAGNMLS